MIKKTFLILFIAIIGSSLASRAQKVLMEQTTVVPSAVTFGPNEANYVNYVFQFGTLVGMGDPKLPINDLFSNEVSTGFKYKRKFSGFFSAGVDLRYHYAAFNINQVDNKPVPDTVFWGKPVKHEKERFSTQGILVSGFLRFNLDPHRGNFMGYYLDIGGGIDLVLGKEYLAIDKKPDGSLVTTTIDNLPYMNTLNYYTFAKLGVDWVAVCFTYRMSTLFKTEYHFPEPPVCSVGIEINPYGH